METFSPPPKHPLLTNTNNNIYHISMLKPKTLFFTSTLHFKHQFRSFCSTLQNPTLTQTNNNIKTTKPTKPKTNKKATIDGIKEKWLLSLSSPPPPPVLPLPTRDVLEGERRENGVGSWVIGVDPDASGALALLKPDTSSSGCVSAQVFDSPFVKVPVGKRFRKRLDARSIVQLVQSFEAPAGTIAYVEQSTPFPGDGKQGWWGGGFSYGLWIGVLVASGFSVIPVPSMVWKKDFELAKSSSTKDDSRQLAAELFPDLIPMLKRKKDHGRAEALLIAAYGKSCKLKQEEICAPNTPETLNFLAVMSKEDEEKPERSCMPDISDEHSPKLLSEKGTNDVGFIHSDLAKVCVK